MASTNFDLDLEELYRLAKKHDEVLALEANLFQLKRLLEKDFELESFFADSCYVKEHKLSTLKEIFKSRSILFEQLLELLMDHGKLSRLPKISEVFSRIVARQEDLRLGEVVSADFLKAGQIEQIISKLGGKILLKNTRDPRILGGFVIRLMGGTVIDASLKGRLNQLRERIANAEN